jgi:hypothetical protein
MPQTLVLSSRRARRAMLVQGGRHALIGFVLLLNGLGAIGDGAHASWVDYLGVASGALLLVAFAREVRAARRAGHGHAGHGIGWVDVFAGLVTFVEAAHYHHQGKHLLPWAYALVGVLLLVVGFAHPAIGRMRRLVVDERGFDIRLAPWRRVRRAWSDVASFSSTDSRLDVTLADGRVDRLDLGHVDEAPAAIALFESAARRALAARATAPSDGGAEQGAAR